MSVRQVRLDDIDRADCVAEGFPHYSPDEFTLMFKKHMGIRQAPDEVFVTRIEFRKVPGSERVAVQQGLAL